MVDSVSSINAAQSANSMGAELSVEAFLKLFMAELKQQNPLDPVDSKAFMAQLASFSNLTSLNQIKQDVAAMNQQSQELAGFSLLGKYAKLLGQNDQLFHITNIIRSTNQPLQFQVESVNTDEPQTLTVTLEQISTVRVGLPEND